MYKSKFINILKTLNAREIRLFQEYLRSPFFNKNRDLVDLFTIIEKEHPAYEGDIIERKQLYKAHFQGNFNEPKLRYAFTDLTKLLEGFLIYQQFQATSYTKNQLLLTALKERELEKYFVNTFKQVEKERKKSKIRDINYLNSEYELNRIALLNTTASKSQEKDTPMQKMLTALDTFFIGAKLKYTCEIYSSRFERNRELDPLLLEEILAHIKTYPYENTPTIQIYLSIFNMITNLDDESHFLELTEKLDHYGQYFGKGELHDMYVYARNYCVIKINDGHGEYFRKLFELYQDLIEKKLVYIEGYLPSSDYRNVVYVGLELGEHEYVKKFIYEQKKELHPKNRQNIFDYNLACYYFAQKNYDQTLQLLNNVEKIEDSFYYLDMHVLILRTYYEMDEIIPLSAHIDRLKTYLQRNKKVSASYKASYMNFIKMVKKLTRVKLNGTKKLDKLKDELENSRTIASRNWIRNKIKELDD